MREGNDCIRGQPPLIEIRNNFDIVGMESWCGQPIVAEEIVGYRRLVSKREELIKLYFREGIFIDSVEPIEHPMVCVRPQPSPYAVRAQGKQSELVQDVFLAHLASRVPKPLVCESPGERDVGDGQA